MASTARDPASDLETLACFHTPVRGAILATLAPAAYPVATEPRKRPIPSQQQTDHTTRNHAFSLLPRAEPEKPAHFPTAHTRLPGFHTHSGIPLDPKRNLRPYPPLKKCILSGAARRARKARPFPHGSQTRLPGLQTATSQPFLTRSKTDPPFARTRQTRPPFRRRPTLPACRFAALPLCRLLRAASPCPRLTAGEEAFRRLVPTLSDSSFRPT